MGRRGSKNGASGVSGGNPQKVMTLREQSNGRKQVRGGGGGGSGEPKNVKAVLKVEHLKNLALWAGGEAAIPSLGALFGNRLAACEEAMGGPLDPSLLHCQRCESVLQPGYNCTVRVEKNRAKVQRRRKKASSLPRNNVVYSCNFCLHRNIKRGTPSYHMKEIVPSKPKPVKKAKSPCSYQTIQKSSSFEKATESGNQIGEKVDEIMSFTPNSESILGGSEVDLSATRETTVGNSPATPLERMRINLSEKKHRKRKKSGCNKQDGAESNTAATDSEKTSVASSKRRRKSWSSLKEIAEKSERKSGPDLSNITIPFVL